MKVRLKNGTGAVPQLGDVVLVVDRDKPETPGIVCGFDDGRRHLLVTLFDRHLSRLRVPISAFGTASDETTGHEGTSEA